MKKFIAVFLSMILVLSFAGCKDDSEAAKDVAKTAVSQYYDFIMSSLEKFSHFPLATHKKPTINKVEKESDGRYVVTGVIEGIIIENVNRRSWTADWIVTVEKDSDGEFKVANQPKPNYGVIKYLD